MDSVTSTISDVFSNSTEVPLIDALEDLVTTNDGPIKLQSVDGNITINAGINGDGVGVSAGGAGDVLLEARGTAGSDIVITADADVVSATGRLTLVADR